MVPSVDPGDSRVSLRKVVVQDTQVRAVTRVRNRRRPTRRRGIVRGSAIPIGAAGPRTIGTGSRQAGVELLRVHPAALRVVLEYHRLRGDETASIPNSRIGLRQACVEITVAGAQLVTDPSWVLLRVVRYSERGHAERGPRNRLKAAVICEGPDLEGG